MLKLGLIGFMKILGTSQFFMAWVEGYRRILENHVPKEYKAGNIENGLQIPPMRGGGGGGRIVRILQSLKGNQVNIILIQPKFSDPPGATE